jgi:hypothetical protein
LCLSRNRQIQSNQIPSFQNRPLSISKPASTVRSIKTNRIIRTFAERRTVEKAMKANLTAPQLAALQADLENIDRVSAILPMRHSETYFGLKRDIDATRAHLASRLVEARSQAANAA